MSELVDSVLGWNAQFLRTTLDSLLHPARVARAALDSDTSRYASPLRLFIVLVSGVLALNALVSAGVLMSFSAAIGASPEAFSAWLEGTDVTVEVVDASYGFWMNIAVWPLMFLGGTPFILLLKVYRPARTLYGHFLIYLLTNNGAMGVQILIMLALAPWADGLTNALISTLAMLLIYMVTTCRLVFALYSETVLGGVARMLGVIVMTPIALIMTTVLQFLFVEALMQVRFDLSVIQLLSIEAELTQ